VCTGAGPPGDNGAVDVQADLDAPVAPESLFSEIERLDAYPDWLEIVGRVEVVDPAPGDPGPAWLVDLRGQLGPFRRSKRLRMVRSVHEAPHRVEFTRRELDGRSHSRWTLGARVEVAGDGSRLHMALHYGGGLWVPMLDRLLAEEIERSKPRLLARLGGA
jgi:hypothetical protein